MARCGSAAARRRRRSSEQTSCVWQVGVALVPEAERDHLQPRAQQLCHGVLPTGIAGFAGLSLHHAAVLLDLGLASQFVTEPSGLLLH